MRHSDVSYVRTWNVRRRKIEKLQNIYNAEAYSRGVQGEPPSEQYYSILKIYVFVYDLAEQFTGAS